MNPEQNPENNEEQPRLLTIADKRQLIANMLHPDYRSKRHVVRKGKLVILEEALTDKLRLRLLKMDAELAAEEQRQLKALEPKPPKVPVRKDHKAPLVKVSMPKHPSVMFLRKAIK